MGPALWIWLSSIPMATLPFWSLRLPRQAQGPSLHAPHSAHHGPLGQLAHHQAVNVTGPGPPWARHSVKMKLAAVCLDQKSFSKDVPMFRIPMKNLLPRDRTLKTNCGQPNPTKTISKTSKTQNEPNQSLQKPGEP